MKSTISLINHASVKIDIDNVSIISDPWYEGAAFHKGWKLIYELPYEKLKKYFEKADYVSRPFQSWVFFK